MLLVKDRNFIKETEDKIFEAYLEYAGACYVENILAELDACQEEIENIKPSDQFSLSMKQFIQRKNIRTSINRGIKKAKVILPKIAVFFMIIILGFATLLTTVEAARVRFFNFMIEVNKKYTRIQVNTLPPKRDEELDIQSLLEVLYLPEGFQLKNIENLNLITIIYFSDEKGQEIEFVQVPNGAGAKYDTEDADVKEIIINGYNGLLIQKNRLVTIIWHDSLYTYDIVGKIDAAELLKMAESVPLY